MTIGNKIKNMRKQTGFSQDEMAEKLNMSQQVYSRIENDQKELRSEEVKKIADFFGKTVEEIDSWDGTFVFNNFGQTTNGQIQTQNNSSEDQQNNLKSLLEQYKVESLSLKNEVSYLKSIIDRLLDKSSIDDL